MTESRSIRVSGSQAFVGGRRGVTVLDISEPDAPKYVDYVKTPAMAHRISISDSKIFVAAREAGLVVLTTDKQSL